MIVTIHCRDATLWHGDYPVQWEEVSFDPLPERIEGRIHRPASRPIRIDAPYCRLLGDRLEGPRARLGWDATTTLYCARKGLHGLSLHVPLNALEATRLDIIDGIRAAISEALNAPPRPPTSTSTGMTQASRGSQLTLF